MYQVLTPSRSSTLALRHLNYHVRHWGPEHSDLPTLVAQRLHGALARERLFEIAIVPDARLQEGVDRASRRIALALVTLGLYIASSLLMQHAVGPQWGGMPLLALAGYALAIRFTLSIARGRALR